MVYKDSLSFITFECALFNHSFLGPLVYKMRGEIIDILEEAVHTLECTYYICLPFIKHRFPKRVAIQKKTDRYLSQIILLYKISTHGCDEVPSGVSGSLPTFIFSAMCFNSSHLLRIFCSKLCSSKSILPTNYMIK